MPLGIKRIGLSFNLPMPLYGGVASIDQPLEYRLVWRSPCAIGCRKGPRSSTHCVKVSSFYPVGSFVWMSAAAPAPQLAPYLKIHTVKCAAGNTVPMIVGPTTDNGIEPYDQIFL